MKKTGLLLIFSFVICFLVGCDRAQEVNLDTREIIHNNPLEKTPETGFLRMAIGAMITPKEGFSYYRDFLNYLGKKIGLDIDFIDKTSYAEINQLLKDSEIDVAFVCSGPYVDGKKEFGLKPIAAPQAYGEDVYYSYIIVAKDSPIQSFAELRGKKFAFTDPQSNTGKLVPTYMLARMDETPETFFREHIYTYAHDNSIQAVAEKIADGAAVDSLIWEYANKLNPKFTSRTKIIIKSPPYGIPPVVARPGLDENLIEKILKVLLKAHEDSEGRLLLEKMMIDKFIALDDRLYDPVREMRVWVAAKETAQ